jgi:hypothetical protein
LKLMDFSTHNQRKPLLPLSPEEKIEDCPG